MLRVKKIFFIISTVAILALGLAAYFSYQLYMVKKDPQDVVKKETADLVSKVSMLIVLPEGETPTIATVSDPEALKDQAFFARAEKGDKVLIYAQAKKAILYSVALNKILEVAPLNIGDKTVKSTPTVITAPATTTKKGN